MAEDEIKINVRLELTPNTPDYNNYIIIKQKTGLTISTEIVRYALQSAAVTLKTSGVRRFERP